MPTRRFAEDAEARALWQWARFHPVLRDLLFHIPNGGKRNETEAARMKAMGVRAGVSDYLLPLARGPYFGLWIELKAGNGTLTDNQRVWLKRMVDTGYAAFCCTGWDAARERLEWYLALPDLRPAFLKLAMEAR